MLQGLFGLIVVVALIYGVAWFLKRVGPRTRAGGIVQVLGGASVGPREKVVVVRFGGETLLLGVAPGQVSLLHTAVDSGEVADGSTTNASPRFIDRLRAARSGA
jgi:flagellar protein FliO/FliZ